MDELWDEYVRSLRSRAASAPSSSSRTARTTPTTTTRSKKTADGWPFPTRWSSSFEHKSVLLETSSDLLAVSFGGSAKYGAYARSPPPPPPPPPGGVYTGES